jgi:Na+/proline symporter
MACLLAMAVGLSLVMDSVGDAWKFLLTFASGAGLTWIVRWFWWRANAWTEFAGMLTSGITATTIELFTDNWLFSEKLFITVGISTAVWLIVTFLTSPVDEERLVDFVKRIRPGSPGWNRVYRKHEIKPQAFLGRAILLWLVGLVALFSLNFGIGSLLLTKTTQGLCLLGVATLTLAYLFIQVPKWTRATQNVADLSSRE